MGPVGVFPGSFDPPTSAHLAIARAAVDRAGLVRLDLSISRVALGKEHVVVPSLADRIRVLEDVAATRPWLGVRVTDDRLIVDVAAGYDVVVLGADKWAQVRDPAWYPSTAARDAALAELPHVLVVPRADDDDPPTPGPSGAGDVPRVDVLPVASAHRSVSSTRARAGERSLMLPEAAAFDARTGAWTDPGRYRSGVGR